MNSFLRITVRFLQPLAHGRKDGGEPATADAARRVYNDAVGKYNGALQAFPGNIIAGLSGFHAAKPF